MKRFLLVLLLVVACRPSEHTSTPAADTPVILISIDTLRSDHVTAATTPNLLAFAQDAITFDHAFSHVPQTLPSHTTILTGLLPQNNGVRDNVGYAVGASTPLLAETLKQNGYATGAAVSSYVLRRATGLNRGFDTYDDELEYRSSLDLDAERSGEHTMAALDRWLDTTSSHKVFAFLHLYEPHAPYEAPAEYAKGRTPYDGEVAYADAIAGKFLASLKRRGLYDDALIVILSDHGEGLGQHGEDQHGVFVYRESLQVPLFIKLPRRARAGERIQTLAALTDITPTILGALGIDAPAKLDGFDLLKPYTRANVYAESWFPRLHIHWHELTSLIDARYQFIDAPKRELYDWRADPAQTRNLVETERRTAFAMAAALQPLVKAPQPPAAISPEDQQKLAALGYIGSAAANASGDFPDPKDRIQYVAEFRKAQTLFKTDVRAALPVLQNLTQKNPTLIDEWVMLADAYDRLGRRADAIATLREANKLFPGSAVVALPLAELFARERKFDDARAHAELAMKDDPVLAHEMLAKIALERGDAAESSHQIDAALALAPNRTTTLLAAVRIKKAQNDWNGALAMLDRAAAEIATRHLPPSRNLQADRGEALLHLQRGPEAEQAFRAEVAAFPNNVPAWGNLAVILAAQGRRDEARATVDEAVRRNPGAAAQQMAAEVRPLLR